jgi:hypothetical protein
MMIEDQTVSDGSDDCAYKRAAPRDHARGSFVGEGDGGSGEHAG